MNSAEEQAGVDDIVILLDRLAADGAVEANCMFQLALMVARIAMEPCSETYKDEVAQTLMGLIRAKPKSNVVRLFGFRAQTQVASSAGRATG